MKLAKRPKIRRAAGANNMKQNQIIFAVVLAGGVMASESVRADDTTDAINQLKQQIEALDQKVRVLEKQHELETEAQETKAREVPHITIGNNGVGFGSANSNFVFQLHGQIQVDSRNKFPRSPAVHSPALLLARFRNCVPTRLKSVN